MQREDRFAIAAIAALTILLLSPYLFARPTPLIYPESSLGTDLPRELWPLAAFVKQALHSTGELPLWRPYLLSGAPLVGHPVAPIFYPPHWLVLILPIPLAFNIDIALHVFWMALGTYFYLRWETGARWEGALAGAILFSQAPKWIAHISGGHLPMIAALGWWPWILLGSSRFLRSQKIYWAVLAGIGLAAQLLNDGRLAALTLLTMACMTVVLVFLHRARDLKRILLGWAVGLSVALPLSAVQLLPFLELAGHSTHLRMTIEEAAFGSLPPSLLLNTLFPPELKYPEWFLYPGIGALALVTYGLAVRSTVRERFALLAIVVATLLSLGASTPLYRLMYAVIPGYSALRVPARWWLYTLFALALLAAWGLDKWLSHTTPLTPKRRVWILALVLVYSIAAVLKLVMDEAFPFDVFVPSAGMILLLFILLGTASAPRKAILAVIIVGEIWWTASGLLRPQSEAAWTEPDPIISLLQSAAKRGERSFTPYGSLEAAQLVASGLRTAEGYDSFALDTYARLGHAASGCDYAGFSVSVPPTVSNPDAVQACPEFAPNAQLLTLLNVRYVLLPSSIEFPAGELLLSHDGRSLYELEPGLGRAFGVAESVVAPGGECIDTLTHVDLASHAVLEEPPPQGVPGKPPTVISSVEAPNRATFVVDATDPGFLVRSESWAPGWTVAVDGEQVPLLRVDCALQGVWLEAGTHTVVFTYAPSGYAAGRWISLAMCALLLASLAHLTYQHQRYRKEKRHA